jgi:hypothetical protein
MKLDPSYLKLSPFLLFLSTSMLMAATNTVYINQIPDLTQSRIHDREYGYGFELCAPVAVSNSFVRLTHEPDRQIELVKLLASSRYMNTNVWKGTRTTDLLNGVDAFARDMFGGYSSLEYQGWKKHPAQFSTGIDIPGLSWITEGIDKGSAVWLNVGWYRYDSHSKTYQRVGGHWVTLVGHDGNILIIHDPAPRAGRFFANEFVHTYVITDGVLAYRLTGLNRSAKGYLLLGEGMHIKSMSDTAIVDGAVKFTL